jgi:hypothetical protein
MRTAPVSTRRPGWMSVAAVGMAVAAVVALALIVRRDDQTGMPLSPVTTPRAAQGERLTPAVALEMMRLGTSAFASLDVLTLRAAKDCMAAKGFDIGTVEGAPVPPVSEQRFEMSRYASPHQQAGIWGYGFNDATSGPTLPEDGGVAYQQAFMGAVIESRDVSYRGQVIATLTVGDGCRGEALASIFGSRTKYLDAIAYYMQVETRSNEAWSSLSSGPTFVQRQTLWSSCMTELGHQYALMFEPHEEPWAPPRPTEAEQHTAEADASCRTRAQLTDADMHALESAALARVLAEQTLPLDPTVTAALDELALGRLPDSPTTDAASTTTNP